MIDNLSLLDNFKEGVLYIVLPDQKPIEFSSQNVRAFAKEYLDSPDHVPDNVRKALDFQRCSICPCFDELGYCHALYPTLSIFELIDKYPSFEQVRVFYLDPLSNCLFVKNTSLQDALQYVSILSLINYCELGRKYHDYFFNVTPLMKPSEIASHIYMNAFWLFGGDRERTIDQVKKFIEELRITIICQVKRLRLICKNDAFLNSFAMTHVLTDLLKLDMVEVVNLSFKEHQLQKWYAGE